MTTDADKLTPCPSCGTASSEDYDGRGTCWRCFEATLPDKPVATTAAAVQGERELVAESFAGIRAERTRWLWENRIPLGTASLLVGREKLGKSTLTNELAARLSQGELPGDLLGLPAASLLVSYEDSASRTIKPRLMAAGADLELVHRVLAKRGELRDLVSLPDDVEHIRRMAIEKGARLVVVDPLSASLNGDVNAHRDQDIRRALAPLVALAEEADLAILALAHWNKAAGGDSLSRVLGSRGLTAAVRSVLAFGRTADADDGSPDRVLAHAASNLAPEAPSLACRIEGREIAGDDDEVIATSRLVILGESDTQADDLLVVRTHEERSQTDEAIEWLTDELADGTWHPSRDVKGSAAASGITPKVLRTARDRLSIETRDVDFPRHTEWRLPVVPTRPQLVGHDRTGHNRKSPVSTGSPADPQSQSGPSHTEGTTGQIVSLFRNDDDRASERTVADVADAELLAVFPDSTVERDDKTPDGGACA